MEAVRTPNVALSNVDCTQHIAAVRSIGSTRRDPRTAVSEDLLKRGRIASCVESLTSLVDHRNSRAKHSRQSNPHRQSRRL